MKESYTGDFFKPISESESFKESELEKKQRERIELLMREIVESMLRTGDRIIGKGRTAEVHVPIDNANLCIKIVTEREFMGKNPPKPRVPITDLDPHSPETLHVNPEEEGLFLLDLQQEQGVIIPTPYAWYRYEYEDEGETYYVKERINLLAMRKLNAVSLDDVYTGKNELPKNVDWDGFFTKLHAFVASMHEKKIYHRDFHKGNIMVDLETGEPCVIDFGRSAYGTNDEVYDFERMTPQGMKKHRYATDEDALSQTEKEFRKFLAQ